MCWKTLHLKIHERQRKKDKGSYLQKVILKRALKFQTLGSFIKNKKIYIQYIALGIKIFVIHVCITK